MSKKFEFDSAPQGGSSHIETLAKVSTVSAMIAEIALSTGMSCDDICSQNSLVVALAEKKLTELKKQKQ